MKQLNISENTCENCYQTSTNTTHKHKQKEIIGPCGPCAFINLIQMIGSFELEKQLAEMGRIKPFHACNHLAFLIWGKKFKKELKVFVSSRKLQTTDLNYFVKYESITKTKIQKYKQLARKWHDKFDKKFSNQINDLENPLQTINELLKQKYRIAILNKHHWTVILKKEKNNYLLCDSGCGTIFPLTKKVFEYNLKESTTIIAYKERFISKGVFL